MIRAVVAFLTAPLVVPAFACVYFRSMLSDSFMIAVVLGLSTMTAYVGALLFGLPAYLLLRRGGWTSFWFAPVIGFVAAAGALWLFDSVPFMTSELAFRPSSDVRLLGEVLWPFGPVGAVVGALLWLIARPDRPTRSTPSGTR